MAVLLVACYVHNTVLSSYDPVSNLWKSEAPMGTRRLGVGVAVTGGCLYAVGGSDGAAPLASVERYVKTGASTFTFLALHLSFVESMTTHNLCLLKNA